MALPFVLAFPLIKAVVTVSVSPLVATEIGAGSFIGGVLAKIAYDYWSASNPPLTKLDIEATPLGKRNEDFDAELKKIHVNIHGISELIQQVENLLRTADKDEKAIDAVKQNIGSHLMTLSKSFEVIQSSFQEICQFGANQTGFQSLVKEKIEQLRLAQTNQSELLIKMQALLNQNFQLRGLISQQQLSIESLFKINRHLEEQNSSQSVLALAN